MDYLSRRKKCSCCHFQSARPSNDHQATSVSAYPSKRGGYIDSMLKAIELHEVSNDFFKNVVDCCRDSLRPEKGGQECFYLPGRVSDLATSLSYVNGDDFAHDDDGVRGSTVSAAVSEVVDGCYYVFVCF